MSAVRSEKAARNNALWCDVVCRAHGKPGVFLEHLWLNRHPVPRYYSNAVTLSRAEGSSFQQERIRELMSAHIADRWSVKDSFCTLDLTPMGFSILFEATWLSRGASLTRPRGEIEGVRWAYVKDPLELERWEAAWDGAPDEAIEAERRIFRRPLLAMDGIAFVAGHRGGRIVAGAVANRTGDVVGLSNVFTPADEQARYWPGCVAGAIDAFPGLPLVGYERGADLMFALEAGFSTMEPLRVWIRRPPAEE